MGYTIADIGRGLQRFGLRVAEHPDFGGVGRHSENSHHYYGEAIDVTDHRANEGPEHEGGPPLNWRERTRRLKDRARQLGVFHEVLGPGDKDHDEHAHLALRGKLPGWGDSHTEFLATGRWRTGEGSFSYDLPVLSGSNASMLTAGESSSGGSAQTRTVEEQRTVPVDWKASASDPNRSTDPSSQAYWQRQDMRLWAEANPKLAAAAMARSGADAAWLQAPQTRTETIRRTETVPAAGAAGGSAVQPARPADRGALNGTQVGGPRPRALQPFFFEIHADAAAEKGGRTGFIGSYIDRDNPLFQTINQTYGNYGPNHSRQWRDGDLGGPRRGLSIIETRTAGAGMGDPAQQQAAAQRLLDTFLKDRDVKDGIRPVHFFAGHSDTADAGAQGAAGGDAPEKVWSTGVMGQLRTLVQKGGYRNFNFHDGIVDDSPDAPNANWNRAAALRRQWQRQQQQQRQGGS